MVPGKEPTEPVGRAVDRLVVVVGIHPPEEAVLVIVVRSLVVAALGNHLSLEAVGSLEAVEIRLWLGEAAPVTVIGSLVAVGTRRSPEAVGSPVVVAPGIHLWLGAVGSLVVVGIHPSLEVVGSLVVAVPGSHLWLGAVDSLAERKDLAAQVVGAGRAVEVGQVVGLGSAVELAVEKNLGAAQAVP